MQGENIDGAPLAADRERDLNPDSETMGAKPLNHDFDDRRMRLIQQPIEALAMPPDAKLNLRVNGRADGMQRAERDPADAPQLDPADRVLRDMRPDGEIGLAKVQTRATGADR